MITVAVMLAMSLLSWLVLHGLLRGFQWYEHLFQRQALQGLAELFLFIEAGQVWLASVVFSMLVAGALMLFTGSVVLAVLGGLAMLLLPPWGLHWVRKRRLWQIEQQLPDFALALASALRAGSSLQYALRHVSELSPPPLAQELALLYREQRLGLSFDSVLQMWAQRLPAEGIRLLVSALRVSIHSGGSLAETLERLAITLRTRQQLQGRILALTAQGRLQAGVMVALPLLLAGVLTWLSPESMQPLWTTPTGWMVLLLIIFLESLGLFFIRKIINIAV